MIFIDWIPTNITYNGHEFFFIKNRQDNGSWYNWVCILESQKIADEFESIITFTDKDRKDVIMYRGNVISIDVSKIDRPKIEGSVLLFQDSMVRKIWNQDDQKINYKITVQKK